MSIKLTEYEITDCALKRFWKKVGKSTDCWVWTACKNEKGYGVFTLSSNPQIKVNASRLSYRIEFGDFPTNLQVLHHCHNRACVRPNHLYLGTAQDNVNKREKRGSRLAPRGSRHPNAKLDEQQVITIKQLMSTTNSNNKELAAQFKTTPENIYNIRKGITWSWIQ